MLGKHEKHCRRAAVLFAAAVAAAGMTAAASETDAQAYHTVSEESDAYSNVTITLQEIVDANSGIENLLGSSQMIGISEVKYDEDGTVTESSQYAVTRTDDRYGYAIAFVYDDYTLTYKSGSAWVQYANGQSQALAVDAEQYASLLQSIQSMATVGYSESEELIAQYEKDGKIYVKSTDPEAEDSTEEQTVCFYYVLDPDTLQCSQLIESLQDADGNETKVMEMTVEYAG